MNNTHLTTQLTDITEQIKRLDVEALKLAQSAKIGILQATDKACGVGSLLKESQKACRGTTHRASAGVLAYCATS